MSLLGPSINSIWDEKSWSLDAPGYATNLYKLEPYYLSLGSIDNSFDQDFFEITVQANYEYTIKLTSDSFWYGWNSFNDGLFIEFDLVDSYGQILLSSQSVGLYDDELVFSANQSGTYYVNVHGLEFSPVDYALAIEQTYLGPPNYTALFENTGFIHIGDSDGTLEVGEALYFDVTNVTDLDGISSGPYETFIASDPLNGNSEILTSTNNFLVITQELVGKQLGYYASILDSNGKLEESFQYYPLAVQKNDFDNIEVSDPLSFREYFGTDSSDTVGGAINFAYFGAGGDDTFNSGFGAYNQLFIGGEGSDLYRIDQSGWMTVYDRGVLGADLIQTTGIGLTYSTTYVAEIDYSHLVVYDELSGQGILLLDYQDAKNKIEFVATPEGTYSYDEIVGNLQSFPNYLGNISWADYANWSGTEFSEQEVLDQKDFYNGWYVDFYNAAPTITSAPPTTAKQGNIYSYQIQVFDPDATVAFTYSAVNLPSWLQLNPLNGMLQGRPKNDDVGTQEVEILVADNAGGEALQSFSITVENVNDAPEISSTPATQIEQGETYVYNISYGDPDLGDEATISVLGLPTWLSFDGNSIVGTPDNGDVGDYDIHIGVSDLYGAQVEQNFTINVLNVNDEPETIISYGNKNTNKPVEFEHVVSLSDPGTSGSPVQLDLSISDDGNRLSLLDGGTVISDINGTQLFFDPGKFTGYASVISPDGNKVVYTETVLAGTSGYEDQIFLGEVNSGNALQISSFIEDAYTGFANTFSKPLNFSSDSKFVSFNYLKVDPQADRGYSWTRAVFDIEDQSILDYVPENFSFVDNYRSSMDGRYSVQFVTVNNDGNEGTVASASNLAKAENIFDLTGGAVSSSGIFLTIDDNLKQETFILRPLEGAYTEPSSEFLETGTKNYQRSSDFDATISSNGEHIAIKEKVGDEYQVFYLSNPIFWKSNIEPDNSGLQSHGGGSFDLIDIDENAELTFIVNGSSITQSGLVTIEGQYGDLELNFDQKTFNYSVDTFSEEYEALPTDAVQIDKFDLILSDGLSENYSELRFAIRGIDDPFKFDPLGNLKARPNEFYSVQLNAVDPDTVNQTENIIYSGVSLPVWLSITSEGVLSGVPTSDYLGGNQVTVQAADPYGSVDQMVFTINVNDTNELSGTITSRGGGLISDVTITGDVAGTDTNLSTTSSDQGGFILEAEDGIDLTVIGDLDFVNARPTKAITAQDALDALRLAVGLDTTSGSKDAFSYIAADFNQSGKVTAQDALEILKYAVGLEGQDAEWKFFDSDGDYSGISRSNTNFDEGITAQNIATNLDMSMTGILLGDVNDTYTSYLDIA